MTTYMINKGIGATVEFKGLKAQYLFIFSGGLLAILLLVMILYLVHIPAWLCLSFGILGASLLIKQTFRLNTKYGTYGLMKITAKRRHPRYIINRKPVYKYFKQPTKGNNQ